MEEDLTQLSPEDLLMRLTGAQHSVNNLMLAQAMMGEDEKHANKTELARSWGHVGALYEEIMRRLALVPPGAK